MLSRSQGLIVAVLGVALAVVLFVVLGDGEDGRDQGAEREPEVPLIEIRDGQPVGGVAELEFESDAQAEFEVEADAADELHLHGYDLYIGVGPGRPRRVSFEADIEGVFELESHTTAVPIAEIAVAPN